MNVYWLIAILPHFIITLLTVVGILGLLVASFVGKIPFIKQYNLPIKIASLILFVCGVYLQGAAGYKAATDKAVAELQSKLAKAQVQSVKVNTQIVEKVVKDTKVIHDKGKTITQYVDREVVKHDQDCRLPAEVIRAHNAAASLDTGKLSGDKK